MCGRQRLEDVLDLVVEHQHDGAAGAPEDVGEGALEEGGAALRLRDRHPAVERVLVHDVGLLAAGLHHHAPADRVEGVGHDAGERRDGLEEEEGRVRRVLALPPFCETDSRNARARYDLKIAIIIRSNTKLNFII